MFDMLKGNRKKKEMQLFGIPEKKYTTDPKIISKMAAKALIDLYHDQEKYIAVLTEKIEQGKQQYFKTIQKCDELLQKNEVVNSQVVRMTNEHEELSIKFDNLQTNLEIFSSQNEKQFRKQIQFFRQNQAPTDKLKNMAAILSAYRQKFNLCKKIESQNKVLKGRYLELEEQLEEAEGRIKELQKQKNYNSLIPNLMQEIQELKSKPQENSQHNSELEEKILQRVKNQIESSKPSEDQEIIKVKQAEIEKLKMDIVSHEHTLGKVMENNEELNSKIQSYQLTVISLEQQIAGMKKQNSDFRQANEMAKQKQTKLEQTYNDEKRMIQEEASVQAAGLLTELEQQKQSNLQLKESMNKAEELVKLKQQEISKLNHANELMAHDLQVKKQQLQREQQSKGALQKAFNGKTNQQIQNLLQLKAKLQSELSQAKGQYDNQKKSTIQNQQKLKRISQQNDTLKASLKRMNEQKVILQENLSNCLKISQEDGDKLKTESAELKKQNQELKKEVDGLKQKVVDFEEQVRNQTLQIDKLVRNIQSKDAELKKSYTANELLEKDKVAASKQLEDREEEEKIKARKYESQLNQERIKLQSANRKLSILQSKTEENKTSLDGMYEQLLAKDKKIGQMEVKLKEYKYKIQLLRKQKQDMENCYQNKFNNMIPEETNLTSSRTKEEEPSPKQKEVDAEKQLFKNQLSSLKEENKAILVQNQSLRGQIEQLSLTIGEKNRIIRVLQQKRDNIMKEIQKISKNNTPTEPLSSGLASLVSPKDTFSHFEGRQKKIASKALKGFEIVLKQEHQFYKNFMGIFGQQLQQEQIKGLQKELNAIIKKSSDMKDVFEGYLD